MEPVSNVDRILLLLRQRLSEQTKAGRNTTAGRQTEQKSTAQSIAALAANKGIDERAVRRTLIQALLAEQFGSVTINDARFQQVVSQVFDAIEDDPSAQKLLERVTDELKKS